MTKADVVPAKPMLNAEIDIQAIITRFERPLRAWSLIVTVFGDVVIPRGGSLWLGTLLPIMAHAGIEAGVVRTAASQLVSDGWLVRERVGRNSYYRLSSRAERETDGAAARIYGLAQASLPGPWTLAVLTAASGVERLAARQDLLRIGAGQIATDVFIAPAGRGASLAASGRIVLDVFPRNTEEARNIARLAWPLDDLAAVYRRFISTFGPMAEALACRRKIGDLDALLLRVLVVHEWRRIILRDPDLSAELHATDWPGHEARRIAAAIWRALLPPSECWLDAHGKCSAGALPKANASLADRFSAREHG